MKPETLLEQLETAAAQLAIKVSYEALAASVGHGGLCRVKHQYRVIIDKRATVQERIAMVASAVASFDLSGLQLAPKVREVIRFHEGSARLKLPRLDQAAAPAAPSGAAAEGAALSDGTVAAPASEGGSEAAATSDRIVAA
jgi:hypothetical protein